MSNMFKNYPQPDDYIPNNRHKCFCRKKLTIMAGETTTHTFEVPFDVQKDTLDFEVIYKLGLTPILTKSEEELDVGEYDEEKHEVTVSCVISRDESKLFANTLLDANVQMRFIMNDGTTVYTEIYPIKLSTALDIPSSGEPTPQVIVGIGYTED